MAEAVEPPAARIRRLLGEGVKPRQLLFTVTALGAFDLLRAGAQPGPDVASSVGADLDMLTRLLIVERVLPERVADDPGVALLDLNMLVEVGGRQRSLPEYRILLAAHGFVLAEAVDRGTTSTILVATRGTALRR